ncbi:hypothetical protein [Singulisphaera acidiphila]|uniref:Peptidase C-terminal archaeal/bacterial domain-containing protein n=1 Tax=Singulisphaera acidiphila (strain ATCC BAA-1392 / DSM 18658 / VKM B-2454 / MOB10) TaxID=886293 RepID=L0DPF4_SINAD|nr:hypothetical protein [Singulisphaera acidiphila]AGA30723.1 hypothetical protein Sinac_6648 [Singulisphaera acidiphila DSM 18658]
MNTGQPIPRGLRDARSRAVSGRRRGTATPLRFETLETRRVPSSFGDQGGSEPSFDAPNQTYDQALDLGDVWAAPAVSRQGSLGAGEAGAGDVEWYCFVLDRPARVTLRLEGAQPDSSFRGVLSLFNNDFDFVDLLNPQGLRRLDLAVADGGDGVAAIDRVIGPGTYNLAVSGAGNEIFSPLVAHTGLPGSTGEFNLSLSAIDAGLAPSAGPWVLNSNPAPGALLTSSPLVIRIELSRPLDPATIEPGRSVQLRFSSDGTFSDAGGQIVPLAALNFSSSACELQLVPASPLTVGYYRVVLTGTGDPEQSGLTSLDGTPLGSDDLHPIGRDYFFTFQVGGIEGNTNLSGPADDTPAGAHDLGELTSSVPVQVKGAIGDDPFYNPANTSNPVGPLGPLQPGNDVDLYHFRVSGPDQYTFFADVFAGRIGSPLAPGLRLFRFNPETQQLDLLNLATFIYNIIPYTDRGILPQLSDATLSGVLDAGDYYLAVSSGIPWSYDPSVSRSNQDGLASGPYVLNLLLSPTFADTSPYSRIPLTPPFDPSPTDPDGDGGENYPPWAGGGAPPGHNPPRLPTPPGTGGGISIHNPPPSGNNTPPVGTGTGTSGGVTSSSPPFQNKPTTGIPSSTDLSVLAFQPVGGLTRTEQEPATQPGPTLPKAVAITSGSAFSSQSLTWAAPPLFGVTPTLSPEIAIGNVPSRLESGSASITPPAVFNGIVPQSLVPWAPDPDQFNSRRTVVASGLGQQALGFSMPKVVSQPLAVATAKERADAPDGMVAEKAPVTAPTRGDNLGTDPEAAEPAATIAQTPSEPEVQTESPPRHWKLGWALLTISGLSSVAYFKYRESFRPRWLSRSSLCRNPGKRPGLDEPRGSS